MANKGCPFCGVVPESDDYYTPRIRIACRNDDCPAWMVYVIAESEAEAWEIWNGRVREEPRP